MKMPTIMQRKKLRASTARQRTLGLPDEMDYEQMSEPNMKLSRALLIVLMLHVVAVAGIIAFNTIKTRQVSLPVAAQASAPVASVAPAASAVPVAPNESTPALARKETPLVAKTVKTPAVADSGKTYVVAKGDNPVTIAKKLHVSYDALLALNVIEDPRKLQIGQKLRVPARTTSPKHKSD
jgi:LysM repeat protein